MSLRSDKACNRDRTPMLAYDTPGSGRDCDKAAETGLVPVFSDGTTYFEQAKLVIICKKMAVSEITPDSFLDSEIDEKFYPDKDYHKVFVARIEKVLVND